MVVRVVLDINIDTGESKSAIVDRLKCIDYNSLLCDDVDYALEEVGEAGYIELNDAYAV